MSDDQDAHSQFLHQLYSPLTNLQLIVDLLRRTLDKTPSAGVEELLAVLESEAGRLGELLKLLGRHVEVLPSGLHIELPLALLLEPRTETHSQVPQAARQLPQRRLRPAAGATVLIIEDSTTFRSLLGALLRQAGIEVLEADAAEMGLDLARQRKPDLIVIDLVLPLVNGQQLASVLRDDPETRNIPLLVCTALEQEQIGKLEPQLRVIHKSDNLQALPELIAELIAEHRRPARSTVLLIDDDDTMRQLLVRGLQDSGYHTLEAATGQQGLQLAQRRDVDVIVLDLRLPDVDGFDLLCELRQPSRTLLTPVILLSAIDTPADKVRGLQLGADDFVTKPFILEELLARIRATLRRHQLESDASPCTLLPGSVAIERAISARIASGAHFAIGYADLDNFKAYNDCYGFLKGDGLIRQTARIITSAVERYGTPHDFVGHVGGDDFVFVTTPERVEQICRALIAEFDHLAPLYYDSEARSRGYIDQYDRQGNVQRYPLVSVSIGVVTNATRLLSHPAQVSDIAAELKRYAKRQPGSLYIIDRRANPGDPLVNHDQVAGKSTSEPLP